MLGEHKAQHFSTHLVPALCGASTEHSTSARTLRQHNVWRAQHYSTHRAPALCEVSAEHSTSARTLSQHNVGRRGVRAPPHGLQQVHKHGAAVERDAVHDVVQRDVGPHLLCDTQWKTRHEGGLSASVRASE